jgi:asparagine synthase (glutamine-hydrolysing)
MCGIAGIYERSGAPVSRALIEGITGAMAHRGPDGFGYLLRRNVALGHRRLSIIDVAGGAQPISNEDDLVNVVFNGEIYNFVELREELRHFGHTFKTSSDTEVIVHAYEQWGEAFVGKLNGIFAFALFDERKDLVLVARDHLGVKPLYYASIGSQLVFASEIKALQRHTGLRLEVDLQAVAQLFTFRYVPSPQTLMKGIQKLPPGHLMTLSASGVAVRRYWQHIPSARHGRSEAGLVEEYQSLVEDAVRLQMRSDVPVGLFLSSGVDSAALLALMSHHSSAPIEAFTIEFEGGQETNEAADAKVIAMRHGARHHTLQLTSSDYAKYFDRYLNDLEEPVGHEAAPAFYFLAQLASEHVKVALSGQGADEPWAGYGRYIGVKLSSIYSRLPTSCTNAVASMLKNFPGTPERLRRGAIALGEPDTLTRFGKIYSFFSADMKAQLYRDGLKDLQEDASYLNVGPIRHLHDDVRHLDPLSQILYIDTRTNLPDDLLMVGDKTSMANSLEVRVPYLDYRMVEFVENLPSEMKLRGLTGKYLHKRALLKWLPHGDVYRVKKGFANPLGQWLRTSLAPWVDGLLLEPDTRIANYLDQQYIRKIVMQDRQGQQNFTRHVFLLLSLEMWHRSFAER